MNGNPSGEGGGGEEVQVQIVGGESETQEQQGLQGAAASQLVAPVASASVAPASVQVVMQGGWEVRQYLRRQALWQWGAQE